MKPKTKRQRKALKKANRLKRQLRYPTGVTTTLVDVSVFKLS